MIGIVILLSACQPSDTVLPTVASISEIRTQTAPTQPPTATPTSTPRGLVLPATFTPTVAAPTETPFIVERMSLQTATTAPLTGTIYYLRDQQSIMAQPIDGSAARVVRDFGVGALIEDMILSPDSTLLAFAAPQSGSTREIYVMNLDGSYLQQVSCLGLPLVHLPAWTPDSAALTWYAATSIADPGNIYQATLAGSGNCPDDNRQQALVRMPSPTFAGMVWTLTGDGLIYTRADDLLTFDPLTQASTVLAYASGFGPNRLPRQSVLGEVAYLLQRRQSNGELTAGASVVSDILFPGERQVIATDFPTPIIDLRWSSDGSLLLGIGSDQLSVWERTRGIVMPLVTNLDNPTAVFSPDSTSVAYTITDRRGVTQWALTDLSGSLPRVLTQNTGGTITHAFWVP